jgi:4-amino-4-deoxy-L-arabinose transferase-like glycosyltransferase
MSGATTPNRNGLREPVAVALVMLSIPLVRWLSRSLFKRGTIGLR